MDDSFAFFDQPVSLDVEVEYLDVGTGKLLLEYDGYEPGQRDLLQYRYRPVTLTNFKDTGMWQKASARLRNIRFANRQNGGADFRLWGGENRDIIVRRVTMIKR